MDDGETATDGAITYTILPRTEWYQTWTQPKTPSKQAILRVVSLELIRLYELGCDLRDKGYDNLAAALDERVITAQWAIVNQIWKLLGGGSDGGEPDADGAEADRDGAQGVGGGVKPD